MMKSEFYGVNTKIWLKLALACSIATVMVLPYVLELSGQGIPPLSDFMLISALAFVQSIAMYLVITYLGLRISKKIGIEATPVLSGKIKLKKYLKLSIILGIAVGVTIIILDIMLGTVFTYAPRADASQTGALEAATGTAERFLASFYGGITEEVLMRLFLVPFLSILIIGFMKVLRIAKTWKCTDKVAWISIIVAAILFGLGHLPITSTVLDITPAVVLRAVLLNGVGGVVFGWLFYRKGLEFAMISHFSADIVIHVVVPALGYML